MLISHFLPSSLNLLVYILYSVFAAMFTYQEDDDEEEDNGEDGDEEDDSWIVIMVLFSLLVQICVYLGWRKN